MWQQQATEADLRARLSGLRRVRRWWLGAGAALVALVVAALVASPLAAGAAAHEGGDRVAGAGKTIIEGGTGGANPSPVTTIVAFHASAGGGAFECLALAPTQPPETENGEFTVNVMYVTGKVTSVDVQDDTAILRGTATVTGIGAGQNVPFKATVKAGGPGTTITLEVSGLTFHEILLEGHINVG